MAAILAEWSRTDIDYSTRIAQLTGSMSGGLNGSYLLNANTVHGNGLADNLYGGPGMDCHRLFRSCRANAILNRRMPLEHL